MDCAVEKLPCRTVRESFKGALHFAQSFEASLRTVEYFCRLADGPSLVGENRTSFHADVDSNVGDILVLSTDTQPLFRLLPPLKFALICLATDSVPHSTKLALFVRDNNFPPSSGERSRGNAQN